MKLFKISAATLAITVLIATPALAINIAPRSVSGSVVKIQPCMIRTPGAVGVAALEGISPYNLYVQVFAHE